MPTLSIFPKPPGLANFLGGLNIDTRFPGRLTPSFDHVFLGPSGTNQVVDGTDLLQYCCGTVIETNAPASPGNARQYTAINKSVLRLDNGIITDDTAGQTSGSFGNVVQDIIITDAGGAGTIGDTSLLKHEPILLVSFGDNAAANGSANKGVAFRHLDTDTSPYEIITDAGTTSATLGRMCHMGPDLVAVCDGGRMNLGDYHVSLCPAGNDPTLSASWGNGIAVGSPEWSILNLQPLWDSFVVGKPDGLFYYDDQTKRFYNVLPHLAKAPHPGNGKVMAAVENGVIYTTHDCKAYFFDGINVTEITPLKNVSVPRDIGGQRITAIADNGETVAMVTDCWWNTTQQCGLKVVKADVNAANSTDLTANVIDGNLSTPAAANMGSFGSGNNTHLYVGADVPIEAVIVRVTRAANSAAAYFQTPQYWNGSAWANFTAIIDASVLVDAAATGGSLNITGFPTGNSSAFLTWTDINAFDLEKTTNLFTMGAKYWVRFPGTGTMSAGTTIDEVEIVPGRPGLPVLAANDFTHRDRAGGITHVLLGRRSGTGTFTWHDVYAIHTYGGVLGCAWHAGRVGQATGQQNMAQSLILWGRWRRAAIMESPTRDPVRTIAPRLVQYGTTKPGPLVPLAPLGIDFGHPEYRKRLNKVVVDGEFLQPTDTITVYGQWDQGRDTFEIGRLKGGPGAIDCTGVGGDGRTLYIWLAYADNAVTDIPAPQVQHVILDYDLVGQPYDWTQDPATATPETT